MIKDEKLNQAEEKLNSKILKSEVYRKYVDSIMSNKALINKVREFSKKIGNGFDEKYFEELLRTDIDFCNKISSTLKLSMEFSKVMFKASRDENLYSSIIYTKLSETMYGNELKDDISRIDVLFTILESVFSLDCLLDSLSNKDVLSERFNTVFNGESPLNFDINLKQVLELIKDKKSYDDIKVALNSKMKDLMPYIATGLDKQATEVSKSRHGLFDRWDFLYNTVMDLSGKQKKIN